MQRNNRWRQSASAAQVVRKSDRRAKGIHFSNGLPLYRDGTYRSGYGEDNRSHCQIVWGQNPEKQGDPHRAMVCDMKGFIDKVVDERFGDGKNGTPNGKASTEDKQMFQRLVKEEKDKDEKAHGRNKPNYTKTSNPYKARAALGLIQLLSSILG